MKIAVAALAFGVAILTVPAVADDQEPAKDPNEQICKREKKVNSRFTTKTCLTRGQWEAIAEANKRDFAENQSRHKIVIRRDQ